MPDDRIAKAAAGLVRVWLMSGGMACVGIREDEPTTSSGLGRECHVVGPDAEAPTMPAAEARAIGQRLRAEIERVIRAEAEAAAKEAYDRGREDGVIEGAGFEQDLRSGR